MFFLGFKNGGELRITGMIKTILKLKKEEINAVFDSLLIGSPINKLFYKYIIFVILFF